MALLYHNDTYCPDCIAKGYHLKGEKLDATKTLTYYRSKCKDMNKYRYIREHAKKVTKKRNQICMNPKCRYNKHVETCHIQEIKNFVNFCNISRN